MEVLEVKEVAEMLGLSPQTIKHKSWEGVYPKILKGTFFDAKEIREFAEKRGVMKGDYMKVTELAEKLNISTKTLMDRRRKGLIPKPKVERKSVVGWDRGEIEEWLKTNPISNITKKKCVKWEIANQPKKYKYSVGEEIIDFKGRVMKIERLTAGPKVCPAYITKRNGKEYKINEPEIWGKK